MAKRRGKKKPGHSDPVEFPKPRRKDIPQPKPRRLVPA